MSIYDLVQLIIAVLSLIATIAVSVILYLLERKQEKKSIKEDERIKKINLEHEAEIFIIKNGDEIEYLPLCVFAHSLFPTKKHRRAIYNNYNICSEEVRRIVLEKQGIRITDLPHNWFDLCVERMNKEIKKFSLGKDLYYDNAKYIKSCMDEYGKEKLPQIKKNLDYMDYTIENNYIKLRGVVSCDLYMYIVRYINFKKDIKKYSQTEQIDFVAPCDKVYKEAIVHDRKVYCYWSAKLMRYICSILREYVDYNDFHFCSQALDIGEQYFEDIYYCAIYELFLSFFGNK